MFEVATIAQATFFVEGHGATRHAYWIDYEAGDTRRTHIAVFAPQRTLLPTTGIAFGLGESAYDISRATVPAWLKSKGYRIVGELDAPPAASTRSK